MRKIHDIELDGQTGPDGKFHATGVSLVENSTDPNTGIFADDSITFITTEQGGHQSTMKVPESCVCLDHCIYEGDTTVITVTLHPAEILKAMRQRQDPEQLVLLKLKEAGAPVQGAVLLSLKTGYLTRCNNLYNDTITFEWRSK